MVCRTTLEHCKYLRPNCLNHPECGLVNGPVDEVSTTTATLIKLNFLTDALCILETVKLVMSELCILPEHLRSPPPPPPPHFSEVHVT